MVAMIVEALRQPLQGIYDGALLCPRAAHLLGLSASCTYSHWVGLVTDMGVTVICIAF